WLWDTGYASHFNTYTSQGIFRLYPKVTPVYFEPHEALVHQLDQEGIKTADLSGILLSHFHGDHIAGLRDFPDAPLYCQGSGWQALKNARGINALRQGFVPKLLPDDFESRLQFIENFHKCGLPSELHPFETGWELPESHGEVFLVDLPGHAKGHIGAFVRTNSGWVLLAGDAAWAAQNYTELREPAMPARLVMDNYAQFRHTLHRLHELHLHAQVKILLCHEGAL
ncbi:MAG: MBL fold metallo-hydrolase, partial [Saezia sp.]